MKTATTDPVSFNTKTRPLDAYDAREGVRVLKGARAGTITWAGTGSLYGAVEVLWRDGGRTIERSYRLRTAETA